MSVHHHSLLSAQHMARFERLIRGRKTGLVTLSFAGHDAVFGLENGEIGYLFFHAKKGLAALSLLCDALSNRNGLVKLTFDNVPIAGNEPFLPLTETVLNRLHGSDQWAIPAYDANVDSGRLTPLPGVLLTDDIKPILEHCMTDKVGPLATQICADVFKTTRTVRVAIEALAHELPDPELAYEFKETAREQIRINDAQQYTNSTSNKRLSTAEVRASTKAGIMLTEEVRAVVKEILPHFMGTKASSICDEVFHQATTLRAALDHIVTYIANPIAAQQFKEVVRKRLINL